jgi:acetoin utilization protein AcuB
MSKPIPPISKYMTTTPHTIGSDQTIAHASKMLSELDIRHLPVLVGGRLAGIISDRDIALVETLREVDPEKVTVEEAMTQQVYAIPPETPLDVVVSEMAERKYGSAIIIQNSKVVGIFTTIDVCRAFAEMMHTRLAK